MFEPTEASSAKNPQGMFCPWYFQQALKLELSPIKSYAAEMKPNGEAATIRNEGNWPDPTAPISCDKYAHPSWAPMTHKTLYHPTALAPAFAANAGDDARRVQTQSLPVGRVVQHQVHTGDVSDEVVHNMCAGKTYCSVQAKYRTGTLSGRFRSHTMWIAQQSRHGFPQLPRRNHDSSFFTNIKAIDGTITMEDLSTIDFHRAKIADFYNTAGDKGYCDRFLRSLPSTANMPPVPAYDQKPSDPTLPPTYELVQMNRCIMWELFDESENSRMEFAYAGLDADGNRICHVSSHVRSEYGGTRPCSWNDFSDSGFHSDLRHNNRNRHTIRHSYANAPADAHVVHEPTPSGGCYDDIMDYYGMPLDYPLRHYHPIWIRGGQGHSSDDLTVGQQGFWDDIHQKQICFPVPQRFTRHTVPFLTLTSVPVELAVYEPHLVENCIFHWTGDDRTKPGKSTAEQIFRTGWLRAGRDGIYFAWNVPFAGRPEWKGNKQHLPNAPTKYKPQNTAHNAKREIGIGFNLRKLLQVPGLGLREFPSGALITPIDSLRVEDFIEIVFNWDGTVNYDYYDPANTVDVGTAVNALRTHTAASSSSNASAPALAGNAENSSGAAGSSGLLRPSRPAAASPEPRRSASRSPFPREPAQKAAPKTPKVLPKVPPFPKDPPPQAAPAPWNANPGTTAKAPADAASPVPAAPVEGVRDQTNPHEAPDENMDAIARRAARRRRVKRRVRKPIDPPYFGDARDASAPALADNRGRQRKRSRHESPVSRSSSLIRQLDKGPRVTLKQHRPLDLRSRQWIEADGDDDVMLSSRDGGQQYVGGRSGRFLTLQAVQYRRRQSQSRTRAQGITAHEEVLDELNSAPVPTPEEELAAATNAMAPASAGDAFITKYVGNRLQLFATCQSCGYQQSPSYPNCQRCQQESPELDSRIGHVFTPATRDEWIRKIGKLRQEAHREGKRIAPTRMTTSYAQFGTVWRKYYGRLCWLKPNAAGEWIDWDAPNDRKTPEKTVYCVYKYKGFVDLMKRDNISDDGEAVKCLGHLYQKFKDKHGYVNIHLAYQAAHFIDWWCWYVGVDEFSQNVGKDGHRKEIKWLPHWGDYKPFRGKPSPPWHQRYCKHAFENFWISNQFWNTPGTEVITTEEEEQLTRNQQREIDDLWWIFTTTGDAQWERGYLLNEIPARLHADWRQSALRDREEMPRLNMIPNRESRNSASGMNALAPAFADEPQGLAILAPPVSPPSPGYHPRDDSPDSTYRNADNTPASSSGEVLAPRAIKSAGPQPPWAKPIGARSHSSQRTTSVRSHNDLPYLRPRGDVRLREDNAAVTSAVVITRNADGSRRRPYRSARDTDNWN